MSLKADKTTAMLCHHRNCLNKARYYYVDTSLLYCPEHWRLLLASEVTR